MSPLAQSIETMAENPVFTDYTEAIAFLRRRGGKYSIRPCGIETQSIPEFTGQRDDAADVMAVLSLARASTSGSSGSPRFALVGLSDFVQ